MCPLNLPGIPALSTNRYKDSEHNDAACSIYIKVFHGSVGAGDGKRKRKEKKREMLMGSETSWKKNGEVDSKERKREKKRCRK